MKVYAVITGTWPMKIPQRQGKSWNYYTKPATSGGGFIYNIPKGAFLKQQTGSTQGFTLRAQLNYDKQVAADHSINVILGGEIRKLVRSSNTGSYFGYNDQTLFQQPVDFQGYLHQLTPLPMLM